MKFGDKDYALVPDRLKQFREENPRGSIETQETYNPDGSITFRATIVKDLADENSARATGSARYTEAELKRPKSFEKLETISIGRSLSNLGYLNDGRIASTEEMEEFYDMKNDKLREEIEKSKDVAELMELFKNMTPTEKKEFTPLLGERRKALANVANSN
jgi:hypothetical protein